MKHLKILFRINLEENIYFVLYFDDMIGRNGCLVYKDAPKATSEYAFEQNISECLNFYNESVEENISTSGMCYEIPQINKIFMFCKENDIYSEDFFNAFFEYFRDTIDYKKIRFWIKEVIEPQKPKLAERVCYDK